MYWEHGIWSERSKVRSLRLRIRHDLLDHFLANLEVSLGSLFMVKLTTIRDQGERR
jgi:hypothetical protein